MVILLRNTILSRAVSYVDFFLNRHYLSAVSTLNESTKYSEIKSVLCCKKSQLVLECEWQVYLGLSLELFIF